MKMTTNTTSLDPVEIGSMLIQIQQTTPATAINQNSVFRLNWGRRMG